MVPLRVITLRT